MGDADDLESNNTYDASATATRYRCEDCGYKWQVRGFNEETGEEDDTVYYDGNEDLEPTACPMCGCSDILTL